MQTDSINLQTRKCQYCRAHRVHTIPIGGKMTDGAAEEVGEGATAG